MLGAIIGDICGSIYERNNVKSKNVELFAEGCHPTDDTIMTIAVAQALMDTKGMPEEFTESALIDAMHYYGNIYPRAGYGSRFRQWLKYRERMPYNSYGNGAPMRVAAAGWLYDTLEETIEMAALTASVTHNHPEGFKGAIAIASAIFLARTGASKEDIREYLKASTGYNLDTTVDEIRPTYTFSSSSQGSVPQAIVAFLDSTDFEDAIRNAISLGGDSDTIAAMTGAIAEAFYGIPEWMEAEARDILSDTEAGGRIFNNSMIQDVLNRFRTKLVMAI